MRLIKKLFACVALVVVVGAAGFSMGYEGAEIAPVSFTIGLAALMTGWGWFE